jgi:hypothetical protein
MTHRLAAVYTPPDRAVLELRARRARLSQLPTDALSLYLSSGEFAVMFRHIATPNFELERFASLAVGLGLTPLVLEFHGDMFLTRNPIKCALARLGFCAGSTVRYLSVLGLPAADRIPLERLKTSWGQPLVAFHHELLAGRDSLRCVERYDTSEWLSAHGATAHAFYPAFLSLFSHHAIMFESFLLTRHEHQFTSEVIIPSFNAATEEQGLRPLVCRLDPPDNEGHRRWHQYPEELYPTVMRFLQGDAP